jgi:hypothetical protein
MDQTCFEDGADCHWECMYINGGRNITIANSKFRGCALFDIFTTLSGDVAGEMGHRDLKIEGNWFAAPWEEDAAGGSPTRSGAVFMAWCVNGPPVAYQDVLVGFNSFEAHAGLEVDNFPECAWQDIRVVGNLMLGLGCQHGDDGGIMAGWFYGYNVFTPRAGARACGPTDVVLPKETLPYVQPVGGPDMDFHLAAASIIDDHVPMAEGCPETDIDGQKRPAAGALCDAGADER